MVNRVSYNMDTAGGHLSVTISPENTPVPGGAYYATGVYKLSQNGVGIGNIIFDIDMRHWKYDGLDDLTYDDAEKIADFIRNYKDPAGADPNLLF
jgi:hypothetical protein